MERERTYGTVLKSGENYIHFEFESKNRANTKLNMQDCRNQFTRKYGYNSARKVNWERFSSWIKD